MNALCSSVRIVSLVRSVALSRAHSLNPICTWSDVHYTQNVLFFVVNKTYILVHVQWKSFITYWRMVCSRFSLCFFLFFVFLSMTMYVRWTSVQLICWVSVFFSLFVVVVVVSYSIMYVQMYQTISRNPSKLNLKMNKVVDFFLLCTVTVSCSMYT